MIDIAELLEMYREKNGIKKEVYDGSFLEDTRKEEIKHYQDKLDAVKNFLKGDKVLNIKTNQTYIIDTVEKSNIIGISTVFYTKTGRLQKKHLKDNLNPCFLRKI